MPAPELYPSPYMTMLVFCFGFLFFCQAFIQAGCNQTNSLNVKHLSHTGPRSDLPLMAADFYFPNSPISWVSHEFLYPSQKKKDLFILILFIFDTQSNIMQSWLAWNYLLDQDGL